MRQVCTIGLDIAKNKFQVHGEDERGVKVFNKQLLRSELLNIFARGSRHLIFAQIAMHRI